MPVDAAGSSFPQRLEMLNLGSDLLSHALAAWSRAHYLGSWYRVLVSTLTFFWMACVCVYRNVFV